ncbi:MAG TPA: hypothetical protein VFV32_02790 [Acidimicrobiales bacterium]|nr:hypothetical protein [Acidimicrobiales bacterium]
MTRSPLELVRLAAASAALVLALTSQGDALVLGLLLAVTAWRPLAALAIGLALGAVSWRWGSTALEAWAGGQAVLGPAGWLEPARTAAGAWLAAGALVLVAPVPGWRTVVSDLAGGHRVATVEPARRSAAATAVTVALGLAAADVVAGPALGDRWWIRVLGAVLGPLAALAARSLRRRVGGRLDVVALAAAAGALVAVTGEAPAWSGSFDGAAAGQGLVVALAVSVLSATAVAALAAMGLRRARRLQFPG